MIFIYLDCIVFHLFLEIFLINFCTKLFFLSSQLSLSFLLLLFVFDSYFSLLILLICYYSYFSLLILLICYYSYSLLLILVLFIRFSHQTLLSQLSSAVCRLFRHDCLKWLKPLQKTLCNLRHIPNRLTPCLHCFLHWFH